MSWDNQTATFLYKAINLLPNDVQHTAIRSQMMIKCRGILKATQEQLPRCSVCGVNIKEILPHLQIKRAHVKNRFLKRQLRKDEYYRTKFQALYISKHSKGIKCNQKMIIKCQLCNKEYVHEVPKPQGLLTSKTDKIASTSKQKKKKKSGKNGGFAGLKQSAVLEAKQNLSNNNTPKSLKRSLNSFESPVISKRTKLDSPNFINLVTPSILSRNDTPCFNNNSVIVLDTPSPNRTNSKQSLNLVVNTTNKNFKKSNIKQSIENLNANITPVNSGRKQPQKLKTFKSTNVVLAMTKRTDKKSKNMDALANILNTQQSTPKPKSMLQHFLQDLH